MAELYLVEFKGSRKEYFLNTYYHNLTEHNWVVVQAERGEDIGKVLKKIDKDTDFSDRERPRSILRPTNADDMARLAEIREKEKRYRGEVITMITAHRLAMKVVDVECQFDGNKMTVFFTADHRVDFRELVKDLAARYRTRIELRQIGVRDEARRLDGYGVCGRRQCCNVFVREFAPISTQHARDQNLPLNPTKISGNCGRLLCCLRYEIDMYVECRKKLPPVGTPVRTKHGDGVIERIDVFNEEAVMRDAENCLFRSGPADILELLTHRPMARPASAAGDEDDAEPRRRPRDQEPPDDESMDEEPEDEEAAEEETAEEEAIADESADEDEAVDEEPVDYTVADDDALDEDIPEIAVADDEASGDETLYVESPDDVPLDDEMIDDQIAPESTDEEPSAEETADEEPDTEPASPESIAADAARAPRPPADRPQADRGRPPEGPSRHKRSRGRRNRRFRRDQAQRRPGPSSDR